MTWKVPVLSAVVLGGSALVVFAGSALVSSTRPAEEDETPVAATANAAVAKLDVRGMTCGSCATTARIALERMGGIRDADVSFETSSATVRYDRALTRPAQFIAELERLTGYKATVVDDAADRAATGTAPVSTPAAAPANAARANGDR